MARGGEHAVITLPTDYTVSFELTPNSDTVAEWANVLHFSATGENCCGYGDRIPGIWFYANTRRLHVRDGHGNDGNAGCDPEEELPANTATTVRVEMRPGFVEVWYNDVLKCTEARGDRQAFDKVVV